MSTVPFINLDAVTEGNTSSTSTTSSSNNSDSSMTGVSEVSQISNKVVQEILQNIVPFQGDMSQIIQNRPQVILPKPSLPGPVTAGDPNRGMVNAQTGAGRQRNDIMQLFHSVGQVATQGLNLKRQKEENELMSDLAIIEAASSNPNDPHNKAILNTIAQDSKKVKRLQKALGYNPLSGEAPPAETRTMQKYGAQSQQKKQQASQLQQAVSQRLGGQAGQQQDAMGNLLSRAPNVPQMNPIVAVQGELIKTGILPKTETSLKAVMDLTKELINNDTKLQEIKAKADAENNRTLQMYLKSVEDGKNKLELERMKQEGASQRTGTRAGATVQSARIHAGATVEAAKIRGQSVRERYAMTHTSEQTKLLDKAVKNIDADIKNLDVQIATARSIDKNSERVKKLTEEQEAKKALKDALEQREVSADSTGSSSTRSATDLLREETKPDEDEMDKDDRIF